MKFQQFKVRNVLASALATAILSIGYVGNASASLVLLGEFTGTGEGYGNVTNLLSMHLPGGAGGAGDIEGGSVTWNGTNDVVAQDPGSVIEDDPNKTATQTFATVGLSGATAAADLRLIWDPSEVGSDEGKKTVVEELTLLIFDALGVQLFSASIAAPVIHETLTNPGLGAGDFVYGLDAPQAATLQAILDAAVDFSNFRIGLDTKVSFVDDGPDTWLVAKGESVPVPEPATAALLSLGLLGFAASRRRRSQGDAA